MKILLRPFALLYGMLMSLRNTLYDKRILPVYYSSLPVISVGNISAGGSGKTPCALYIIDELLRQGKRPALLTRGYGGRTKGPYRVQEGDTADKVGDEPLLYLRNNPDVPVVVARKRVALVRGFIFSNLRLIIIHPTHRTRF